MPQYFDRHEDAFMEIPHAPYYVISKDRFMSGWGWAKGKENYCLVPCQSLKEADGVLNYVRSRGDQDFSKIITYTALDKYEDNNIIISLLANWVNYETFCSNMEL